MKNILMVGTVLLLVSCSGTNRSSDEIRQGVKSGKSRPTFEISTEIHNFGKLVAGEIAVYTFVFRNGGNGNLQITKTETGCSCLSVEADEKAIMPGATGTVKVMFNTAGLYGKQFQSCRIFTDAEGVTLDIAVTAEVINENIEFKQ